MFYYKNFQFYISNKKLKILLGKRSKYQIHIKMSSFEIISNVFFTSGETPQSQEPVQQDTVPTVPVSVPEQTVPTVPEQTLPTVPVTTQELCPSCYAIYPADSEWSGWILRREREIKVHFCSIFCADNIVCSECEFVLGRIPWLYQTGLFETRLCSNHCYLKHCQRMRDEYPDSDDDKEPEVNIDEV